MPCLKCTSYYSCHWDVQRDSKNGLNFVSPYFKIRASDKYDVNYIRLYSR